MEAKETTPKMMILLLVILLVFSTAQAVQLNEFRSEEKENVEIQAPDRANLQADASSRPSSVPVMVGGC